MTMMDLYDVVRTTHAVLPSGKSFLGFRIDREAGEDHQIETDRAAERVSHLRHPRPTTDSRSDMCPRTAPSTGVPLARAWAVPLEVMWVSLCVFR
jgi:hypothetical protein